MFGDEISIDPTTLIEMEHFERPRHVVCEVCGIADILPQADLEAAGWRLGKDEVCPKHARQS